MSECYLTASEQFFRYIMAGTNKLRVASTWVHPWFSDGVRVTHPVVFFVCFSCLCTVPNLASVSALFIHDCLWVSLYCGQCLCFVHSWLPLVFSVLWPVSALFIHDCLWFSLYWGQCLCFVHSWLPLVFSVLWPVSLLCSFMIDCLWFSPTCMSMRWCLLCIRPTHLVWLLQCLLPETSRRVDMSLHSATLS